MLEGWRYWLERSVPTAAYRILKHERPRLATLDEFSEIEEVVTGPHEKHSARTEIPPLTRVLRPWPLDSCQYEVHCDIPRRWDPRRVRPFDIDP